MNNIIIKIFNHYLDHNKLDKIEKKLIKNMNILKYTGRNVKLYYSNNKFIKIDYRNSDQKTYFSNDDSLYLGKFPKEILINNILRKELPNNIIKIKNYYFNSNKQIIIMEKILLTLEELLSTNNDIDMLNHIFIQIFLIIAILQDKFNFCHLDLKSNNILLKHTDLEFITYRISNKTYNIKSFSYIPVLIDFATSSIGKISNRKFNIYDTESIKNKKFKAKSDLDNLNNPNKYRWYLLDNNIYDPLFDIFYLIINLNIKSSNNLLSNKNFIINKYISHCNNYPQYSNLNLSPITFINMYLD
jgi:hypothetical protein